MTLIIFIVIWGLIGYLYSQTDEFDGIDREQITLKGIFDFIIILPIFIVLFGLMYFATLIGIGFNYYKLCDDVIDVTYIALPRFLKRKWLIHISDEGNPAFHDYIKHTPAKLQELIIQHYISNNYYFSQEDFNLLKTDLLKWNYLDAKSKFGLNNWEKEWLVEFTARERDRKIDQILAD